MTTSVLQETYDNSTTNETSVSKQFAGACTPGSVIHAILIVTGTGVTSGFGTPSDGTNTYSLLGTAQATNYAIGHWYAQNSSSAQLTVSEAMGFGTTQHLWIIREIGGVSNTPLDSYATSFNNSQGTGSNAASIGASSSNQPNFASAIGWCYNTGMAAGTTLAWSGGLVNISNSIQGGNATTESLRFTSTGTETATWTPSGSAGQALFALAIFDEAPPATPAIYTFARKNVLYFI